MTQVLDKLQWRYATKKYDPSKVVPDDKLEHILEAIRMAPTSSGLQPFEVFVVSNPAIREQIKEIGYKQPQITDCSHLLVFAAWDDITPARVNAAFELTSSVRGGAMPGWEDYRNMLLGINEARGKEGNFNAAARQAYIGLGVALVAAAFEEVDSTPMEGFDPAALDLILGLGERHLRSVAIMALGYRQADQDWLVNLKKVRRARTEFITEIK